MSKSPGDDDAVMPESPPVADGPAASGGAATTSESPASAPSDATDAAEETSEANSSRKPLMIAGAVVVVLAVVLLTRPADPTYDDASRARFVDACIADGGEPTRSTCECVYDEIAATVPYDRFEAVSDELALQDSQKAPEEPLELPDDIQAMLDTCLQ
jgi:hypothetical protein